MVFSIEVSLKSKSKIYISGGRYSNLLKNLGYKKTEAVGSCCKFEHMKNNFVNVGLISKGRMMESAQKIFKKK